MPLFFLPLDCNPFFLFLTSLLSTSARTSSRWKSPRRGSVVSSSRRSLYERTKHTSFITYIFIFLQAFDRTTAAQGAKELLEIGTKSHIEIILFGLCHLLVNQTRFYFFQINLFRCRKNLEPNNTLCREIATSILQFYLLQAPGIEGGILSRVWHINKDLIVQCMADAHRFGTRSFVSISN